MYFEVCSYVTDGAIRLKVQLRKRSVIHQRQSSATADEAGAQRPQQFRRRRVYEESEGQQCMRGACEQKGIALAEDSVRRLCSQTQMAGLLRPIRA